MNRYTRKTLWDLMGFVLASAGAGFIIAFMFLAVAAAYRSVFL